MRRKYVCFLHHGYFFVFYSEHRLNSRGNREDARRAYSKSKGMRALFPAEEFTNIVNWNDYRVDEPAVNS